MENVAPVDGLGIEVKIKNGKTQALRRFARGKVPHHRDARHALMSEVRLCGGAGVAGAS
jgi:hypothetical protein